MSPTRELAIQIFQVLRVVGKHHAFSVGLLIGGKKDFFDEQQQIGTTNIIIATPGRLLQHLEQTAYLDMSELRVLVLDEADRILDLGFRDQLVRILEYLPTERQTMLFSATQTRNVNSLATMSLREPEYLGVHDKEKTDTPDQLQQSYVVVPVEHKLNAIYSFIKSHLKNKSIIFMSTCAQIRHANDLFCSLRPGVTVMAIHGKLAQERRTQIYFDYLQRPAAVLFATDIAARGLDFPNVDWVVQADAPEDKAMYIHRVGRTARYRAGGKSLLIVTPSEERKGFIDLVHGKNANKVPLKKLSINPTKATIVTERAAALVASNVNLNTLAKKAFQSYVRSITLMPHREIFDVQDIDLDGFSKSLGLASSPNLRFLKTAAKDRTEFRGKKNVNKKLQRLKDQIKAEKLQKKLQKMGKPMPVHQGKHCSVDSDDDDEAESDDELLVSRTKASSDDDGSDELPDAGIHAVSKSRHPKKIQVEGSHSANKHVVFNDEGEEEDLSALLKPGLGETEIEMMRHDIRRLEDATQSYVEKVRARLQTTNEQDAEDQKDRIRQKHKKRRLEVKGKRGEEDEPVALLDYADADDSTSNDSVSSSDDESDSSSVSSADESSPADDADDKGPELKAQEEMALALIRGK